MKIIEQFSDSTLLDNAESSTQQFKTSAYHISLDVIKSVISKLHPGKIVVLFSGSWRLDFDAIYLEPSSLRNNTISSNENTYFVDPDSESFDKTMHDINASNILILHSALLCKYQPMDAIINLMNKYQKFQPSQIILSIPHTRIEFNRLKYSVNDIAQQYQVEIVDDSFVMQLENTDVNLP